MPDKILTYNIEEIEQWHPNLFCDQIIVAAVAVMSERTSSPCRFTVECRNIETGMADECGKIQLAISWSAETEEKAKQLRNSYQRHRIVEDAAIAMALSLFQQVVNRLPIYVAHRGEGADYWLGKYELMLEISGTEREDELERRHRQKITQLLESPNRPDGYVAVTCFANFKVIFSFHKQEGIDNEGE